MKKMNKFFALAALAAAAMTLSSCGTEWLAAVGQGMVGASQAILGAGGATATAGGGSASTFLSGNAGTMSVDGGVPYGNVYVPGDLSIYKNSIVDPYPLGATYDNNTGSSSNRVKCGVCSGTGQCTTCHGKGVSYHGGQYHKCGGCNGTGNCYTCKGAGWHD